MIQDGCYIDFEGFGGNKPPVLIGIYQRNEFKQVVFTDVYRWAAEEPGVGHEVMFVPDRDAYLKDLANSAKVTKPIFAFSVYERRVIERHAGHKITRRYRNVRAIAEKWFKDEKREPKSMALRDVAEEFGMNLLAKLGKGEVTRRLRDVRRYSLSKRNWTKAPDSIRKKWRQILEHNKWDVMTIYEIMCRMKGIDTE